MSILTDLLIAYFTSTSLPLFVMIRIIRSYHLDDYVIGYIIKVIRYEEPIDG